MQFREIIKSKVGLTMHSVPVILVLVSFILNQSITDRIINLNVRWNGFLDFWKPSFRFSTAELWENDVLFLAGPSRILVFAFLKAAYSTKLCIARQISYKFFFQIVVLRFSEIWRKSKFQRRTPAAYYTVAANKKRAPAFAWRKNGCSIKVSSVQNETSAD